MARTLNILLISPRFPETFWSFAHALRFIGRRASQPPLGLLTVAALLPMHWQKRLVDLNVQPLTDADLAWADYAFVGGMVVQRASAAEVIARCKALGVPVVAGGPLFTMEYEAFQDVDHFVLDEAEVTLPRFLADLDVGTARNVYRAGEFADMTTSPVPMWELADLKQYATLGVQYCRGCPYDCDFCNVTALLGHRPRTKTIEQIEAELDWLSELGWRGNVFFVDDNLIGNKRDAKAKLLPALAQWQERHGRRMPFNAQVSMNIADDADLLALMARAGFDSVFIGIESPDEDALAACNKKQNLKRDLIADVRRVQRAGIEVYAGFIVGFDEDTPSSFHRLAAFIQASGIATAMVGMLQAPAGTRLFARMSQQGRLMGTMSGDNVDGTTNIRPAMGLQVLRQRYRTLVRYLYEPRHYYARVRTFLREYRAPTVRPRLDGRRLLAFVRSLIQLGIAGRERLQFWRLLAWTVMRRPRLLPNAVTLAIYGRHFRLISERIGR
ncbi:MAG: B12-binding domain-containing radical SAM protein [Gemmatimonadota bacterium]